MLYVWLCAQAARLITALGCLYAVVVDKVDGLPN